MIESLFGIHGAALELRSHRMGLITANIANAATPGYKAKIERAMVIKVEAFDWNCPQHITQRFTLAEIEPAVSSLRARVAELEKKLAERAA